MVGPSGRDEKAVKPTVITPTPVKNKEQISRGQSNDTIVPGVRIKL